MDIDVQRLDDVTTDTVEALGRLVRQLSKSAEPLDQRALTQVIECSANTVLVARLEEEIIGMLTLVTFPLPTGIRAWIEDVAVDESVRGRGVGTALTLEAVAIARRAGARTVDLTSRPARVAANRLYEGLGFELRDSKVYRMSDR